MGEVVRRSSQRSRSAFDPVCRGRLGFGGRPLQGQTAWPPNRFRQAFGCAECDAGLKEISANIMVVSADQTAGQPPLEPTQVIDR